MGKNEKHNRKFDSPFGVMASVGLRHVRNQSFSNETTQRHGTGERYPVGTVSQTKKKKKENVKSLSEIFLTSFENGTGNKLKLVLDGMKQLNDKENHQKLKPEDMQILFNGLNSYPDKNNLEHHAAKLCGQILSQLYEYCTTTESIVKLNWTVFWISYFRTANSYYLELIANISDPFLDSTDEIKTKFLLQLNSFLVKIKDTRTSTLILTGDDEEIFLSLIEKSLNQCLANVPNNESIGMYSDLLKDLLKFNLEYGPEKKGHFYRARRINIYNKMSEILLILLFHHSNQSLTTSVLRQNVKSLLNVYIINNKHMCYHEQDCSCYAETKEEYYDSVEKFIFTKSSKYMIQDVLIYVSDVIKKYHNLAPYEWLEFLSQIYQCSKNEIEKNLNTFVNLLVSTEARNEEKLQKTLLLLQAIAKQNPNLFNEEKIQIIENSCLFRDSCSSKVITSAFHLLLELSSTNSKLFKNKGNRYYEMSRKIDIDCSMMVNNTLKNIGLTNLTECERVVTLMESEIVRNIENNKQFVQHVLIVWKNLAIEYPVPFKKRKHFLESMKDYPKFSRNAKDILAVIGADSKSCTVM